eukprot:6853650-Pyramimonas_sp.AAC.1
MCCPEVSRDVPWCVPLNETDSEIDSEIDKCPVVSRGVPWCPPGHFELGQYWVYAFAPVDPEADEGGPRGELSLVLM